jgi:outer membrane protein OmpA-like peptidoglycan-associated protein
MTNGDASLHPQSASALEPSEDERMMAELRTLLLGQDRQELRELHERLDNLRVRAQDVSEVVAEALRLREAADREHELSDVLLPSVEHALRESVRKDAQVLAEALYPVMGPAIRKSIYESIRALVQSFNEALSQGFSLRGLKWRIESIRTGRPFAEVVLLHTLVFRVEQVFLIHKATGLLLNHLATAQLEIQDPDMVSGMLSAIRDFVHDSFSGSRASSVDTMQVGDLEVWVEQGPHAFLAIVIRGHAPQRVRFKLKQLLEEVHQKFGKEMEAFQGDAAPFLSASDILRICLESQQGDEEPFRPRPFVPVLAGTVVALGLAWFMFSAVQSWKWNRFVERLRDEPGVVVTSYDKSGGRYHIQGLRDPLSKDPAALAVRAGLDPSRAVFKWKGYDSQDDPMVLKRALTVLKPPAGVRVAIQDGELIIQGDCDKDWASRARMVGPLITGVRALDTAGLYEGGPFGRQGTALESETIFFAAGRTEISDDQRAEVARVAESLRRLLARAGEARQGIRFEIIGHADSTGNESANASLSRERAEKVRRALVELGLPASSLRSRGASNLEPVRKEASESDRRYNRCVRFRVVVPGPSP